MVTNEREADAQFTAVNSHCRPSADYRDYKSQFLKTAKADLQLAVIEYFELSTVADSLKQTSMLKEV